MSTLVHYFNCFGCGKQHRTHAMARICCAVVQEIWECEDCGEKFAYRDSAEDHASVCMPGRAEEPGPKEDPAPAFREITAGQFGSRLWSYFYPF